ncbi:MFS transporter [Hansschlegelia plantiphila]|uniref:MFS transporter n=1 Tax=Hansschlegelia plantiphila TaxID=374655 RepID=A0A9W6J332_9HYPH|nr:MFS transporter [Hansschlegelia plantiphila]GLK68405.1 MFS transporter [Hansschlegelia plantiphila]
MDATPARAAQESSEALPLAALLALAMTGFVCIATETLPAGLLPQIAEGLDVSQSAAGQLVTVYALGSLIAAIPLTIATRRWGRRTVLLVTVVGFLSFNSITAVSSSFALTLAARFLAGASAGLAWSLLGGYARQMAAPSQQGRAMAIAMVGTPIALSLGVPLGTWLGTAVSWRAAFAAMSLLTVGLIGWVLLKAPNYAGRLETARSSLRGVLTTRGVRPVLAVVIAWMLAHNVLYTYVAPFVARAGLAGEVDFVLLVFGVAALAGIWVAGRTVDHFLRIAVLVSLGGFATTTLAFGLFGSVPFVIYAGVTAWGLTFGGAATFLQTALADNAGDDADVALSMNVVAWNGAIAGGGLLGGALLKTWGAASFPWAALPLLVAGLAIAWLARTAGFLSGPRATAG